MSTKAAPYRVGENIVSQEREGHAPLTMRRLVNRWCFCQLFPREFGPLQDARGETIGRQLRTVPDVLRLRRPA